MNSQTTNDKRQTTNIGNRISDFLFFIFYFLFLVSCIILSSCGVYSFKNTSIPPDVKTVRINYIENKSRGYINPQLSPRLTDALQQKISSQTRLTRTTNDNADYQISGYISNYTVSTSGITSQQAATNRLTVGVHIDFVNNMPNATQNKSRPIDVSRDFDFPADLTLTQAENQLLNDIIKNVTDEIFNQIFSNW